MKTYIIKGGHKVKIGVSKNVPERLKQLQTSRSMELRVIHVFNGNLEKELHKQFADYRLKGEWFSAEPVEAYLKEVTNSLVGLWFHSFPNGKRCWQGFIQSCPEPGFFRVLTFEWFTGHAHSETLVTAARMAEENWVFYDNHDDFLRAGNAEAV